MAPVAEEVTYSISFALVDRHSLGQGSATAPQPSLHLNDRARCVKQQNIILGMHQALKQELVHCNEVEVRPRRFKTSATDTRTSSSQTVHCCRSGFLQRNPASIACHETSLTQRLARLPRPQSQHQTVIVVWPFLKKLPDRYNDWVLRSMV
eukprot:CAMPEP_0172673746 /NCGR_PEP_ID=MMETSP1074-20121228/12337_1 /TAXON_ID=2916 /ORGANISM="Ceratium fusus, Strain PA161109" /LENGTH=150 /DNA_ID=CAMNT_0013491087 /DNA_START=1221 /DNA_END=1673 /DNA_ORIENTATION=+